MRGQLPQNALCSGVDAILPAEPLHFPIGVGPAAAVCDGQRRMLRLRMLRQRAHCQRLVTLWHRVPPTASDGVPPRTPHAVGPWTARRWLRRRALRHGGGRLRSDGRLRRRRPRRPRQKLGTRGERLACTRRGQRGKTICAIRRAIGHRTVTVGTPRLYRTDPGHDRSRGVGACDSALCKQALLQLSRRVAQRLLGDRVELVVSNKLRDRVAWQGKRARRTARHWPAMRWTANWWSAKRPDSWGLGRPKAGGWPETARRRGKTWRWAMGVAGRRPTVARRQPGWPRCRVARWHSIRCARRSPWNATIGHTIRVAWRRRSARALGRVWRVWVCCCMPGLRSCWVRGATLAAMPAPVSVLVAASPTALTYLILLFLLVMPVLPPLPVPCL